MLDGDKSYVFDKIVRPAFARAVCAALSLSPFKMPESKVLGFAMSQHKRLGEHSCAFGLPPEIILRIVAQSEVLDQCVCKSKRARMSHNPRYAEEFRFDLVRVRLMQY